MSNLFITNRTITLGTTIYQVSNITSVGKYVIHPPYFVKRRFLFGCMFLCSMGIYFMISNPENPVANIFVVIVLFFILLGFAERFFKSKKYLLSILTNSGKAELIASKNEKLVNKIIEKITEIMNNKDAFANYTFNISDGDIINQSGNFGVGVNR